MSESIDIANRQDATRDTPSEWRDSTRYMGVLLFAWSGYLLYFLFATVIGSLALSFLLYFLAEPLLGVDPFTPSELLLWFSDQTEGAKIAVGAGVLTAVGLVAAYWTAIAAWKAQKAIELRFSTSLEIQNAFQIAHRCVVEINGYLEQLMDRTAAAKEVTGGDRAFHLYYVNERAEAFEQYKKGLYEARMRLYVFFSTHGNVLLSQWQVFDKFRTAIHILDLASTACQFVPPQADPRTHSFPEDFLRRYDPERVKSAQLACARVIAEGSAIVGFVSGRLASRAIKPGMPGLLFLTKAPKSLRQTILAATRAKAPKLEE